MAREIICLIVAALLGGCATGDRNAPLTFDETTVGAAADAKPQKLYLPTGTGRHAAVLILSKCWASDDSYEEDWAKRFASWGYVAMVLDSLRPRGVPTACSFRGDRSRRSNLPAAAQAGDLVAAMAYLRGRPDVDPDRLMGLGIDRGASVLVQVAQLRVAETIHLKPFRAVVASSGDCDGGDEGRRFGGGGGENAQLASDILIMVGERDDLDPDAKSCRHFSDVVDRNGHDLRLKIYVGAFHLFDTPIPLHLSPDGNMIGRNSAAASESIEDVRSFVNSAMAR